MIDITIKPYRNTVKRQKMKKFTVNVTTRSNRTETRFGIQKWTSKTETVCIDSVDELFAKFTPTKPSENLRKAVTELLSGIRDKVEYNYGFGNALFVLA